MPLAPTYRPAPVLPGLGAEFFDAVVPARFPQRVPRYRNQRWAARVGLDRPDSGEWERHCAAFAPLPGNLAEPLVLRYHGHQFLIYCAAVCAALFPPAADRIACNREHRTPLRAGPCADGNTLAIAGDL